MPRTHALWTRRAARKGTALILVLLITVAIGALAMSAILLGSSDATLSKYYDREREFRYAAEAALAMGKARMQKDTTLHFPDTGYVTLMSNAAINGADGQPLPRVKVSLYAGLTGATTGQFGSYASIVAVASDASGARHVRRLELQGENFARYAMFTDTWPGGLCYATGEFIRGLGHSNQNWGSCGSPTYYDTISASGSFSGGSPIVKKAGLSGTPVIPMPSVARLASLTSRAASGNMNFTSAAGGTSISTVKTRIEFVAVNLNPAVDTTPLDDNEGFLRVFDGNNAGEVRADYTFSNVKDNQCGDWHTDTLPNGSIVSAFYPVAAHRQAWFWAKKKGPLPLDTITAAALPAPGAKRATIMGHAGARCYAAGDPHLSPVERRGVAKWINPRADSNATLHWGGQDTTFSDTTTTGVWRPYPVTPPALVTSTAGYALAGRYLFPLHRSLNPGSQGVVAISGPVAISGTLRGRVTLYAAKNGTAQGAVAFIDDLFYTSDPATVLCQNLLGVIADTNALVADNAMNSPQNPGNPGSVAGAPAGMLFMDGNGGGAQDWVFDGVIMSRTGTVGVENYGSHAEHLHNCGTANSGRGCILQAGGVIEEYISATFSDNGDGFGENRSVDQCMLSDSPPYFPTTGRWVDNRYSEVDPARFDMATLFRRWQGGS